MSIIRFLLLLRLSSRSRKSGTQGKDTVIDELASRAKTHLSTLFNRAHANSSSGSTGGILYVYLWKDGNCSSANHVRSTTYEQQLRNHISQLSHSAQVLYSEASNIKSSLDVRVLLQESNSLLPQLLLLLPLSLSQVFVESSIPIGQVEEALGAKDNLTKKDIHVLESSIVENSTATSSNEVTVEQDGEVPTSSSDSKFEVVALGGTFDRLHNGHKILLSEAVLRCSRELIVGVSDESLTKNKMLCELIEPMEQRINNVRNFLKDVAPVELNLRILPLTDPFGPTIVEEDVQLLVVSEETMRGGKKINEIRKEKQMKPLIIHSIKLFPEPWKQSEHEEAKISSSSLRIRTLGERIRPPLMSTSLPYIVGITGGIASGKSTICRYLETRGFPVIDCDKLGHEAYKKGTSCSKKLVRIFGEEIQTKTGEIDRRQLGAKVFGKPEKLKELTDVVWPEIQNLLNENITRIGNEGHKIIIVDAAVLLEAKWEQMCHEVLVAFIPKEEAIRRIEERNDLTREDAERRINSQMSNQERLAHATFAFSSLWEPEFTRKQVDKAFQQIQICIDEFMIK